MNNYIEKLVKEVKRGYETGNYAAVEVYRHILMHELNYDNKEYLRVMDKY